MEYKEFLENKRKSIIESGFVVSDEMLNKNLFDFQKFIVKRSLRAGKYAIFADCGLGKTIMQLEWSRLVSLHTRKPVLILAPLAVSGQTIEEGVKFGISVEKYHPGVKNGVYITNYEQIENIDCSVFSGIVLDESSILKNFEGKIRNKIIENFSNTPFKLACTATPAPNDPVELGNHSEFLNIMSRTEMLSMYFVHDGSETQTWRIKGHAVKTFYKWVSSWGIMLKKPSDIGFNDNGFILPELNIFEEQVETDRVNNGLLFNDMAVNATGFNAELRRSIEQRLNKVISIVNSTNENVIIWIKQNGEADYLIKYIPGSVEVRGNEEPEKKEKKLLGFAHNEFRVLITKTKIAMFGLNYQNCHFQIFASLDFSFESLYQGIRRSYRFMQKEPVKIVVISTDTMQNVIESINRKNKDFERMQQLMTDAVDSLINKNEKTSTLKEKQKEYISEKATLRHGDCVELITELPDESIGFSIFSPPFADLYTYSDLIEDMGNSANYEEFCTAFKYLINQLFRVMIPGRNVAIHCMDLPIQKGREGYIGLRDFSNMIRETMENEGFIYHCRVTIWKDPVTEMQRTKALGLLHKQLKKDSTMSRVGLPDYLLVFRKDGERNNPVKLDIPVDLWQKLASPVWMDINYSDTLTKYEARENNDEKHICPLQLETIRRAIFLWSNIGDTVFTPFAGIGSEIYQAVKMNRKGVGFELKGSYFKQACKNVQNAELEMNQQKLVI